MSESKKQKYIIIAIYEKDGKTPKASHQFRLGRIGSIDFLNKGFGMAFIYSEGQVDEYGISLNGKMMHTSTVEQIDSDYYSFWVLTRNTLYIFEEVE